MKYYLNAKRNQEGKLGDIHIFKCDCGATMTQSVEYRNWDPRYDQMPEWSDPQHQDGDCVNYRLCRLEERVRELEILAELND